MKKLGFSVLLFAVLSHGAQATTVTASQDSAITADDGSFWGNYAMGGLQDLHINPGMTMEGMNAGLVQFDLPDLAGNVVSSATLMLFHTENSFAGDVYTIYRNTEAWDEYSVTGATRPDYDPTPLASITLDANTHTSRYFDVTEIVQDWYDGTYANYGFTVQRSYDASGVNADYSDYIFFASRENANPAYQPILYINQPVPEPETYAMMLVGLALVATWSRQRKICETTS